MVAYTSLREANVVRQAEWDTGGNIDLSYSGNELAGEAGELIEAVAYYLADGDDLEAVREEMADTIICCDLIALRLDMQIDTEVFFSEPGAPAGDDAIKDILIDIAIEVGRISNTIKKRERERFGMVGARGSLEDLRRNLNELVLHVYRLGDAMGESPRDAVAAKFNKTSAKYGLATTMKVN